MLTSFMCQQSLCQHSRGLPYIPIDLGKGFRALDERLVLDNESYEKKGEFLMKCAWYSIIKLLDKVDCVWHARRYMAERAAEADKDAWEGKEVACGRSGSLSPEVHDRPTGHRGYQKKQRGILSRDASIEETGRQRFVDFPEFG